MNEAGPRQGGAADAGKIREADSSAGECCARAQMASYARPLPLPGSSVGFNAMLVTTWRRLWARLRR